MRFRHLPPVCLWVALFRLLTGKLRYSSECLNQSVQTEDGSEFIIFRQLTQVPTVSSEHSCVFVVQFKFKQLSHRANKIASLIPMLLIAGQPGFVSKCYAVNHNNGYWLGMYQWKSLQDLQAYKKSFVFGMMNKRAESNTVQSKTMMRQTLGEFLEKCKRSIDK